MENENYSQVEERAIMGLPREWSCAKHDKNLLIALSSNGFEFLKNLTSNKEYGYDEFEIN